MIETDQLLYERRGATASVTMRVTKEAVRRLQYAELPDASDLVRETYGSEDFHEGVSAFVEKRRPAWRGR